MTRQLERSSRASGVTKNATSKARCSRSSTATTATSCCAPRSCACCGRTGTCCAPAAHRRPTKRALTSTVWMGGVFHSMLTQGHVSINRFLSTTHSYLGLFRSHGQRVFVEIDGALAAARRAVGVRDDARRVPLDLSTCGRLIEVRSRGAQRSARADAGDRSRAGEAACACSSRITSRSTATTAARRRGSLADARASAVVVAPAAGQRRWRAAFPNGCFRIAPLGGTELERVGGDELLFADGASRDQPYVCLVTAPAARGRAAACAGSSSAESPTCRRRCASARAAALAPQLTMSAPAAGAARQRRRAHSPRSLPWFAHDALDPLPRAARARAVLGRRLGHARCLPGPVELLLALGHAEPVRDLLLRVMQRAERRRRLAAVVHVLRARARHPRRRLARRHRVLAAARARAVPARLRRRGDARRARAVLRPHGAAGRARHACGSTSSARSR